VSVKGTVGHLEYIDVFDGFHALQREPRMPWTLQILAVSLILRRSVLSLYMHPMSR